MRTIRHAAGVAALFLGAVALGYAARSTTMASADAAESGVGADEMADTSSVAPTQTVPVAYERGMTAEELDAQQPSGEGLASGRGRAVADAPARQNVAAAVSSGNGWSYRNCREARAAGAAPLYRGQPGYGAHMDGDGDGIACEPYRGTH